MEAPRSNVVELMKFEWPRDRESARTVDGGEFDVRRTERERTLVEVRGSCANTSRTSRITPITRLRVRVNGLVRRALVCARIRRASVCVAGPEIKRLLCNGVFPNSFIIH